MIWELLRHKQRILVRNDDTTVLIRDGIIIILAF